MTAATLSCPHCGAAASPDDRRCGYCSTALARVACPACLAPVFEGSRHCGQCGARADRRESAGARGRRCPGCRASLASVAVGEVRLDECADCGGTWLEPDTFLGLCAHRERQGGVLAALGGAPAAGATRAATVRYLPCPDCGKVMNRVNYARASGVILDVCREHGSWFEADELRRVLAFVGAGGLDRARERERQFLAEERRLLEARRAYDRASAPAAGLQASEARPRESVVGTVLRIMFDVARD